MERPVHQCPCPDCQAGTSPIADHHSRLNRIPSRLDEQQRRWVAAAEAHRLGYSGFNQVGPSPACTRRPSTGAGTNWPPTWRTGRPIGSASLVRAAGPSLQRPDPSHRPVETRRARDGRVPGHQRPVGPDSVRGLAQAFDHRACPTTIGRLLRANRLGLRGHRKRLSRTSHADRDTPFRYIADQRRAFARAHNLRIIIDAKKRE